VPLYCREHKRKLGKISIHCPETMTLEEFERLKILAEGASAAFAAFAQQSEREEQEAERNRQAMETAVGETCHQLQSKITALETLSGRYAWATSADEIYELNHEWSRRRQKLETILKNATTRLRPLQAKFQGTDLAEVLRNILKQHLERTQFRVDVDAPWTGYGPASFPADFDPQLIEEAFDELIQNSRKAKARSQSELFIQVRLGQRIQANRNMKLCRIEFRDNGPGVMDHMNGKLFDEFRSEWSTPEARGSGLGLSLVRRIARAHSGQIHSVDSDAGACFVVEFPRYRTADTKS